MHMQALTALLCRQGSLSKEYLFAEALCMMSHKPLLKVPLVTGSTGIVADNIG